VTRKILAPAVFILVLAFVPNRPLDAQADAAAQVPVQAANPSANLNITPKRLTFDHGQRSATVYLFNQGTSPASVDISLVDRVMLPNGQIISVADAQKNPSLAPLLEKLKSAQAMVIAAPRRVVLAPSRGQTIRIRVTAPAQSGAAEYRTHLTVTTIPPRSIGFTAEQAAAAAQSNQVSFQAISVFGVSIPIIVRSGPADIRGAISDAHLAYANLPAKGSPAPQRTPVLSVQLDRLGANSLFGNFEVRAKDDKSPLGFARGIAVYSEIPSRTLELPLRRVPRRGEQLDLVYTDDDVNPGKIIAKATLVAP
jgi:P pilus assembly chaperone PapD